MKLCRLLAVMILAALAGPSARADLDLSAFGVDASGCATCGRGGSDASCDGAGCDSCGAVEASCCPGVTCCNEWTFITEVMFLRRSDADPFALITDQNTGDTLVDAENLEFDHRGVPRYQLIRENDSCWGWDIAYFGIDSWNTTKTGGDPVSPVLNGPGVSIPSTAPGTIFEAGYGTDLYSSEMNVRRRVNDCVVLVGGFRWIELRDDLRARSVAPTIENIFAIDTNNHMYGFQLGADAVLLALSDRVRIDAIGRAGILANDADQSTSAPGLSGVPGFDTGVSATDDHTAFIGELGLRSVFQLSEVISVSGGYNLIWLDGLALAPDQLPVSDLTSPAAATLDTGGTLFFHGASVGVHVAF